MTESLAEFRTVKVSAVDDVDPVNRRGSHNKRSTDDRPGSYKVSRRPIVPRVIKTAMAFIPIINIGGAAAPSGLRLQQLPGCGRDGLKSSIVGETVVSSVMSGRQRDAGYVTGGSRSTSQTGQLAARHRRPSYC